MSFDGAWIDTVGTGFTKAGAAASIAEVDGTPASVAAALANIDNGVYEGQVPALGLINTLVTTQTAQTTFETANKAALDALVADLEVTVGTSDSFATILGNVQTEAQDARDNIPGSTSVLTALAGDAAKETAKTYGALTSTQKVQADAYVSAVKANAALEGAADADVAGVKAGLAIDAKFDSAAVAKAFAIQDADATYLGADVTSAGTLYDYYTAGTTTAPQRALIDAALKDVPYFATFKATATIDAVKNAAAEKESVATGAADSGFVSDYQAQVFAAEKLADAKAADVSVDAAEALAEAFKVQTDAVAAASKAIGDFNDTHTNVAAHDILVSTSGSDTVKDVFYFGTKATTVDHTIAANNFGTGDSIVLSKDLAFNSGALSTGDNNKAEFFLVQKGSDTLVIIETQAFGSSTTTHTATGDATAVASPEASVITLTGVTADHLTVNNGVVSYV